MLDSLVLKKFKSSEIIQIRHYKDIFNRTNQDFQVQKRAMKLILAKKTGPLLYPATDMVQDYKNKNSFYNTPALNCLYNCEYCFLQGMYPSGHLVLFVNENDFDFNQDSSIEFDEEYRSPGWDRYKKNKLLKWKK